MTQKAYMLIAHSEEEIADLRTWLAEHPDAEDMKAEGMDPAVKPRIDQLFAIVLDHGAFPSCWPVPPDLVPVLEWVIEDWAEVLGSHNEEFHTELSSLEV